MNFLLFSFFLLVAGLCQADGGDASSAASASAPTPLDNFVSFIGQQITDLNGQIKAKQAEVDAAQKQLDGLDKSTPQYGLATVTLQQKQSELGILKNQLAYQTALQPAAVDANDTLKKVNGFISDAESAADDSATVAALLDNSDTASSAAAPADVAVPASSPAAAS